MEIITLNSDNIAKEHICCAIADKKCQAGYEAKKEFLTQQFDRGYVFKKFDVRGKVFIEYVPAENVWAPVHAPGYMMINCFWVSGKYKGQGYGKQLLQACLADSKDKNGVVVVTGEKKRPFLNDKKFFQRQGFERCDVGPPYFELWYKKLKPDAPDPVFKSVTKEAVCKNKEGLTVFYTNSCPFTEYYVNTELKRIADNKGMPLKIEKISSVEQAQNHVIPFTIFSLFYQGRFVTHEILSEKRFEKIMSSL
ncbi:GNAT family N-acetyltransferase [Marinilabiliaceae bacterium JC017]|nr:GNAT family N-acetyltransferase [Marinilabiliaceae bacterium JC017]